MNTTVRSVTSPGTIERRAHRTFVALLDTIEHGRLELVTPDGQVASFGTNDSLPTVRLDVRDWAIFGRILRDASVGLGESYMDGQWECDDLVGLMRVLIANRPTLSRLPVSAIGRIVVDRLLHQLRANRVSRAPKNIAAHYDLSNAFYRCFLDESMTYSAAYFDDPEQSLEQAQHAKYARLAQRAQIERDSHVLEIGCGWGGFAVHAAQRYGCRVTGITLSAEQARHARERVAAEGLDDHVDIQIVDYRAVEGRFDRVVSIEMLEAVGHRYLGAYFAAIERVLADDGLVALQVITIPEQRYDRYRRRPDFIQRHIFPGGHLPSLEAMTAAMGRASRLTVEAVDNIGMHYAETLRRWRARFLERAEEVAALGFDARFRRMWEFYLAYCEGAFRSRYISDLQLLLTRPMNVTLSSHPYRGSA